MSFNPGDLVKMKENGVLAIVLGRSSSQYSLFFRFEGELAWYDADELELVERGHYAKLYSPEEIEAFERDWNGVVKFL